MLFDLLRPPLHPFVVINEPHNITVGVIDLSPLVV
jgi:hypothetical protein